MQESDFFNIVILLQTGNGRFFYEMKTTVSNRKGVFCIIFQRPEVTI
jgi:hypothetical protein